MIGRLILALILALLLAGPIVLVCALVVYDELKNDRTGYQYWTERAKEIKDR